jgi:hypothetical protein
MPSLRVSTGSGWVDSNKSGKVLVGSFDFSFAPAAGGPVQEVINWPSAPTNTDQDDGATYNLGLEFTVTEAASWVGVEWNPTALNNPAPGGGTFYASAWDGSGSSLTTPKSFAAPAAGVKQQVMFTVPVAVSVGVTYIAGILLRHYTFRNNAASWDETSPSGRIHANRGRFRVDSLGNVDYPNSVSDNIYYISPIIEFST